MPAVFSTRPGQVVRIPQAFIAVPFALRFGLTTKRAIVTQCSIEHQGAYQLMHSINDLVHIFVFGERIGEMTLSGLAFPQACDNFGGRPGSGVEDILQYYYKNRVAARGAPIAVQFGSLTYQGFLGGVKMDLVRPEALIGQWFFRINNFLQ